jgi:hypothetical protein
LDSDHGSSESTSFCSQRLSAGMQELAILGETLHEPAVSLFELFPAEDWLLRHYGKVARSLWRLVDEVFKPAHAPPTARRAFTPRASRSPTSTRCRPP